MNYSESMDYRKLCFGAMEVVKRAAAYVRERHENRVDLNICLLYTSDAADE